MKPVVNQKLFCKKHTETIFAFIPRHALVSAKRGLAIACRLSLSLTLLLI